MQQNEHVATYLKYWISNQEHDKFMREISDPSYYTGGRRIMDQSRLSNLRYRLEQIK